MSEQEPQRPTSDDDREGWSAYWATRGIPWRTEPEISQARRNDLQMRRDTIKPNVQEGIYPFKDVKLTRADVEWLLATHHGGRWPSEWGRTKPGLQRQGIDLRGADLRNVDLQRLPLMQTRAGLDAEAWGAASPAEREAAAVHLESADLHYAYLQDASLRGAHLEGANLQSAHLEGAMLRGVWLGGAQGFDHPKRVSPSATILRFAHLDADTNLPEVNLGDAIRGFVRLSDVHWNGVDVTRIPWGQRSMIGDEQLARRSTVNGRRKSRKQRLEEYLTAVRGNRQLATLTRGQGLAEVADRFAYRAQLCQRVVLRRQHHYLRYLGSILLWLIAGYGYRPLRSFLTYALVVCAFATAYFFIAPQVGIEMPPLAALVFSVTSFHGRGFTPGENVLLTNPLTVLAAGEAILGLLIEITFIATFTQRFFAR